MLLARRLPRALAVPATCAAAAIALTLAFAFALSLTAPTVHAQQTQAVQVSVTYVPVLRLDVIAGDPNAVQAGAGIDFPLSNYFNIGGTLGAGISRTGFSARGDAYGKFSLDPYHQNPWEPYVGGGVTERVDGGGPGARTYLLGFVGVNGPRTGSISPGAELGFGGGVRFGITLRFVGPTQK